MIVWTNAYRPFIMGGDVNGPVGTDIEVGEEFDLGKGMKGHVITNPINGQTYVVEATTGGIIGPSLEEVRSDVTNAEPAVMAEQLAEAAQTRQKVCVIAKSVFWQQLQEVPA